jgi:hypothetical protein
VRAPLVQIDNKLCRNFPRNCFLCLFENCETNVQSAAVIKTHQPICRVMQIVRVDMCGRILFNTLFSLCTILHCAKRCLLTRALDIPVLICSPEVKQRIEPLEGWDERVRQVLAPIPELFECGFLVMSGQTFLLLTQQIYINR